MKSVTLDLIWIVALLALAQYAFVSNQNPKRAAKSRAAAASSSLAR